MRLLPLLLSLVAASSLPLAGAMEVRAAPARSYPTFGKILRDDPRLDALLAPDARIEVLAGGFGWTEGPVWVRNGGYLLFSDIPHNSVMKWQEGAGIVMRMSRARKAGRRRRL